LTALRQPASGWPIKSQRLRPHSSRTDGVFHQVIVDFESSVAQIARQCIVIVEEVIDGLAECCFSAIGWSEALRFWTSWYSRFRALASDARHVVPPEGNRGFHLRCGRGRESEPDGMGEVLLEGFVHVTARVRQAPDADDAVRLAMKRFVDFIGVRLDRSRKTRQSPACSADQ
jgi:hypothetical protein